MTKIMSGSFWGRRAAVSLAGALACGLALFAGSRLSLSGGAADLVVPPIASSVLQIKSAQEAESLLLPIYFRTIPLSSFGGNLTGLKVGIRLAAQTETGKQLIGSVVAIRETDLIMRVESWEGAAPPSGKR